MFNPDDTIVAIATPPGRGGIGIVRVSGPASPQVAAAISGRVAPLEARRATVTQIVAGGAPIDRAVLTFFPAPHSYTGDDVLEVSAHGSPVVLRAIIGAAMAAGARLAEPGEFTFRAYLRGRIDLVQAEAVRDLVEAVTPLQARAAFDQLEGTLTARLREIDSGLFDLCVRLEASLDFPDEGYHFVGPESAAGEIYAAVASIDRLLADAARGRLVREGAEVAIIGRPNVGKSSLFNMLLGTGRAIVTDVPGTTRDLLTESCDIEGIPVTLVDTAGLHGYAADAVESEGMARAQAAHRVANLTLVVLDQSRPLLAEDEEVLALSAPAPRVIVANKGDLSGAWDLSAVGQGSRTVAVSAKTGAGIDALRSAIVLELAGRETNRDAPAITNMRHADLLSRARVVLERAAAAAGEGTPEELVTADMNEARALLEEVTGARTPDDVLHAVFDRFCIGK